MMVTNCCRLISIPIKNNDYDRLETKNYILNSDINALKREKEEDKKALLEDMFTQFDRLRSAFRDD